MKKVTILILNCLVISFLALATRDVLADPSTDCNSNTPRKSISGCTTLIKNGKLKGSELATAYILRSDARLSLGKTNEAISDRLKAYELDSQDTELQNWLTRALAVRGSQYIEKENLKGALADFRMLHKLQPQSPRVRNTLSELLSLRGISEFENEKIEHALETFNEAISLNPLNAKLYVWRGDVFQKIQLQQNMKKDYDKSIKIDQQQTLAFERRGRLHLEDGNNKKAIEDFGKVLSKEPKNVTVLLMRALASEHLNPNDQSYLDYKTVLKINPNNKDAKAGLKRLVAKKTTQVKLVQIELQRLGCKPGSIDGRWGSKGKAALGRYIEAAGRKGLEQQEPGPVLLAVLKSSKKNICAPPESETPVSCFIFNGEKFCE